MTSYNSSSPTAAAPGGGLQVITEVVGAPRRGRRNPATWGPLLVPALL